MNNDNNTSRTITRTNLIVRCLILVALYLIAAHLEYLEMMAR